MCAYVLHYLPQHNRNGRFLPGDPTISLSVHWIEILFFWRRFATTSECFLPKVSGLCSTHTDHENFQRNCKFIKYWKV